MVQAHGPCPHHDASSHAFTQLAALALVLLTALFAAFLVPPVAASETVLGTGSLEILGSRLIVSPASQTVPFDVPTTIDTSLQGFDLASLPPSMRVRGELRGPEIDGVLTLETIPGQPLRIPALRLEGEYVVENIRLVVGETLLSYAAPREAVVQVTQVLITRVTSRPLTLEEIRSLGIVVGDDSFQMFRFVFGFGVDGEEIVVEFPASSRGVFIAPSGRNNGDHQVSPPRERFRPPQLVPFRLDLPRNDSPELTAPTGGCPPELLRSGCLVGFSEAPMVGVIAIPTDVALLHQFFSVVLMVQNGAPEGDPLVLRDLAARITLPPSLRQAETVPATSLGVPVPIRVPGPDGEVGTPDDLTFLVAQAEAEAEFLVEGLVEGSHVVRFDIDGVLDGLPSGPRAVSGEALGAVVVRDPYLQVTVNHPEVVRTDEAYALHMTVANLGPAPVNLLNISLPTSGLSGTSVSGNPNRTIDTLLPGEAETVSFDMVSARTGKVISSTVRSGPNISPSFELSVGVSTEGIPLSPDAIVLPDRVTEVVPESIARPALSLLGLGHSLATARPSDLPPNLFPVGGDALVRRVYRLAQTAQHVEWGEDPFDSYAVLAAEWQGARDGDASWDALRRVSTKGRDLAEGLGAVFEAEAQQTSPRQMAARFAATTAFLPDHAVVLADGAADLTLLDASGRAASGVGAGATRDLPFAELYSAGTESTLGLITQPDPSGHVARIVATATDTVDLDILLPTSAGIESLSWTGVSLDAGDAAEVVFADGGASPTLHIDRFDDGVIDESISATTGTASPRPFAVIAARQNTDVDPTGHVVDVLFTRDVDRSALGERTASRFEIDGLISDGGALSAGEIRINNAEVSDTMRIVRVLFDNPIGYASDEIRVQDIADSRGTVLASQLVDLAITQTVPGGVVEGTVIGSAGQPVPFAVVELFEHDRAILRGGECVSHKTGAVRADAAGRFQFPFVRAETCDDSDRFRLEAFDPSDLAHGDAIGRVRFTDQVTELNVVMIGRGRVEGRVTYEDGSPVSGLEVRVFNPVFEEGRVAFVGADGRFNADDIMVGAVEVSANDDAGRFAFATVELPSAGEIVSRDLQIVRQAPAPTGQVRGTAVTADASATIEGAILALYVDDVFLGTTTSDAAGRFDFGTVLAGTAEIEIFDGDTSASGGRIFFELAPDAVIDIDVPLRDARATVEGRVLRQRLDGTVVPVGGAIVWMHGQQANTVSQDDGSYRLEGVLAGDQLTVFAADPRTIERVNASVGSVLAGSTIERDLLFIEQSTTSSVITGEVLDFDGLPVSGAIVRIANRLEGATRWSFEASTGGDGRFVLRGTAFDPQGQPVDVGFEPGTYPLHTIAGSFGAVALAEIRFPGDTPNVTLRLERGQVRITTKVRQGDGTEVGVRSQVQWRPTVVEFGLVREAAFPVTVETDANGELLFENVLIGPYEVFVSNSFHGEESIGGRLTDHDQEDHHEIVFEETTGAVRGRILDFDGVTPAAGVAVRMSSRHFSAFDVTTDAEGRYAFELVPIDFSYDIVATLDSDGIFRTTRTGGRLSRGGQVIEDVDLVLPKRGAVVGLVEDADGVRVPGAVVTLREHAYPHRSLSTTADQDGNFAVEGVMAGGFSVRAQAPSLGGLGGRAGGFISGEGQVVEIVITLEATGELTGIVTSPVDGSPVPSARIRLVGGSALVEAIDADENGAYRFQLLPLGTYRIHAFDPSSGRHGQSPQVVIAANGQLVMADTVLQVRGEVEGQVLAPADPGTVPIAGATVRLISRTPFFTLDTHSSTDVDGAFLFGGVPEGDFDLSVREPNGRRRATGEGTIGMEDEVVTVDLVLEAFGAVVGSVLQPPGGATGLIPDVNVRLLSGRRLIAASLENPYVLDGLLPGESFDLYAEALGDVHRGVASGRMPEEGGELPVDVTMLGRGQVTVTVVDSFGNPVSGADVRIVTHNAFGWDSRSASTGADNRVTFTDIEAATLSVNVRDPFRDLRGSTSGAVTQEGESVGLTVVLEDTGFVEGTVVLADGATPATDVIIALEVNGDFRFAQAETDGSFRFDAVPLDPWALSIQEEGGLGRFEAVGSIDVNGEIDDLGLIVLDEADPTVVSITPASGARDVPVTSTIEVAFSEPIDVARWRSDSIVLRRFGRGATATTATWNVDDTVATLTPTSPLESDSLYELFVTTRVVDLAGRSIPEQIRSTFNTADVVPPAVIDIVPRDGENQIEISSPIVITFSEPVVETSLSGSSLALYDLTSSEGVTTTFQLRPSGREAILTAAFGLVADHQYRVTVQTVADASGNVMPSPVVTTFWTVDETFPVGSFVTPDPGTIYTAGDLIDASLTATDNRGIDSVTLHLADGSFVATDAGSDLYTATFPAPRVTSAVDLILTAEIVDIFGNVTQLARTIRIQPLVNASAPTVLAPCLYTGDQVRSGRDLEIPFTITDDQGIERYALYVDGALVEEVRFQHLDSIEDTFIWPMPVTALPGATFAIRLEVTDYAGNVGGYEATIKTPSGLILAGDLTLDRATVDGQHVTLDSGTYTVAGSLAPASLVLLDGATLTSPTGVIDIATTDDLRIQCGAAIDVDEGGFHAGSTGSPVGGAPGGIAGSTPDAGGSHGGLGIANDYDGAGGEVYGSVYAPMAAGGGGALAWPTENGAGGAGGGTVRLAGAEIVLGGDVTARGIEGDQGGSGAGGSIWVEAGTVTGAGVLDASGGDFTWCPATPHRLEGAGGGGRIALDVGGFDRFEPAQQAKAHGGQLLVTCFSSPQIHGIAGAGTVFVRTATSTFGDLTLDGGTPGAPLSTTDPLAPPATPLPLLGTGNVVSATVDGTDLLIEGDLAFRHRWLGAWTRLYDASGDPLGIFEVTGFDASGRLRLDGAGAVTSAVRYEGVYRFDQVISRNGGAAIFSSTLVLGDAVFDADAILGGRVEATSLRIAGGVTLRSSAEHVFDLDVEGTLTIDSGATIDADGAGYQGPLDGDTGVAPDGLAPAEAWGGASHGGRGRTPDPSRDVTNDTYGSPYWPRFAGAAAADETADGGGAVAIRATHVVLDGAIRARGQGPVSSGGNDPAGAGGSILIEASSMIGVGTLDVSGGTTNRAGTGPAGFSAGGGGGRIALWIDDLSQFDVATQTVADGGTQTNGIGATGPYSAPGTVFVFDQTSVFGTLRVVQSVGNDDPIAETPLPILGAGTIGSVTSDPSEAGAAWVTNGSTFALGSEGAWLTIDGVNHLILAESADRTRLLLEGADGVVEVGDAYTGVWKFDEVIVDGGATLVFADGSEIDTITVGDGTVVQPTGSWITPAEGESFVSGAPITAAVDVGQNPIDRVSFALDGGTFTDTSSPFSVDIPAPIVSVATDFTLRAEIVDDFGNVFEIERTITVSPHVNVSAPTLEFHCLDDGDRVLAGSVISLDMTAFDDEAIAETAISVDGVELDRVRFGTVSESNHQLDWTMPASAASGQGFVVRFEALDYAGNLTAREITVSAPSDLVLTGGGIDAASVDGRDVVLASGTYTALEPLAPTALTVLPGATLTSVDDGTPTGIGISASEIRVQCGGAIDVTARGYSGGSAGTPDGQAPAGITGSTPDAGGSHGGVGLAFSAEGEPGAPFGSVYAPTLGGGGGALGTVSQSGQSHAGGGYVHLVADTVVIGGDVIARGDWRSNGSDRPSGAGGSVWIEAGILRGAGLVDASGADYWRTCSRLDGAGGGGRIAIDVDVLDGFDPTTQSIAHGGQVTHGCSNRLDGIAGAGTVYIRTAGSTYGDLHLDGGAPRGGIHSSRLDPFVPPPTPLPVLGTGAVMTSTREGDDLWIEAADAFPPRWLGAWMRLDDASGTDLGSYRVLAIDAMGHARLEGAGAALEAAQATAASYRGEYRFDRVITRNLAQVVFETPWVAGDLVVTDDATLSGTVEATNLTMAAPARWQAVLEETLQIDVSSTLTVETNAAITATGRGYAPSPDSGTRAGAPEGVLGSRQSAGGSHGGLAKEHPSIGERGEVYDSVYAPRFGGGGGTRNGGTRGGGVLDIVAPTVVLDGTIEANGQSREDGHGSGTGAGGTVRIDAQVLRGAGTITADGGTWTATSTHYPGGGGRIALHVDTFDGFDVGAQVSAAGGLYTPSTYAAPGTIYVFDQQSTHGDLYVVQPDAGSVALPDTPLPVLGRGTVGNVTPDATDPADVWVDDAGGRDFDLGVEGMWVRVLGTDYRVVAQSVDRLRLLLADAAGGVMPGDAYAGLYRFDHVTVDNATLVFGDADEIASTTVLGNGAIVAPVELEPPVVSLTPVNGAVVLRGEVVNFDATITDESGVDTATLSIDGESVVLTEASWTWQWTAPMVTVTTDYDYTLSVVDAQGNEAMLARTIRVEPGQPPVIVSVTPAENAQVSGGASFEIVVDVTDDAGVASVTFGFDGASFVDSAAPYAWTVLAPEVATSTPYTITVDAVDLQGHQSSLVRTIDVVAGTVIAPPSLEIRGCVHDGIHALPSTVLPIEVLFSAPVDDTVSSWRILVDGSEIAGAIGLADVAVEAISTWTVPVGASPGESFIVRFESTTAAGGFAAEEHAVTVPASYLTGPLDLDSSHDGQTLVLGPGTFTAQGALAPASLSMMSGARIVLDDSLIPGTDLEIASAGDLILACGATIDSVGAGFEGGRLHGESGDAPTWVSAADTEAGGGHGGTGRKGFPANTAGGGVYDSVYWPTQPGGGGGASVGGADAGDGGGVIRLSAAAMVLDGTVDARGTPNQGPPGHTDFVGTGAGGTVVLETASLVGDGTIDVRGGDDLGSRIGGPGGGGRVAIFADDLSKFDIECVRLRGGRGIWAGANYEAGAGTLYRRDAGATWGILRVAADADSTDVPSTALPALGSGAVTASEVVGEDLWLASTDPFHPHWSGAWIDLFDSAGASLGTFQISTIGVDGRLRVAGAASHESEAAQFAGRYRFDAVELRNGADLDASVMVEVPPMVLVAGEHVLPPSVRTASLRLEDGAVLRPTTSPMRLLIDSTLTVDAGATIDVKGRGFAGAPDNRSLGSGPSWVSIPTRDGGSGSHGGAGLPGWNGSPGGVYGSVYRPRMGGGGGAGYDGRSADSDGTDGGGVLEINAGSVVLDGVLDASGEDRDVWAQGLGAGGSILIHAATLTGTGSILARGGKYDASDWGGGGGGGRVSLLVDDLQGFDLSTQVHAHGGRTTRWNDPIEAAPGTIYVLESTDTWGRLHASADAGAPAVAATTLPTLGSGNVDLAEVEANDLWITAPTTFHPRWDGAWIELFDGIGTSLGRFSVLETDDLGRARVADAASHAADVATYQGLYRFDAVVLGHGASVSATDEVEVPTP